MDGRLDLPDSHRSAGTWAFLLLAALVTAAPTTSAALSLLKLTGVLDVDVDAARESGISAVGLFTEQDVRVAEGFSLLVTLPVALACLLVLGGLVAWKEWAREGALGTFGLGGAFLLVLSLQGLSSDPPGRNAGWGLLASLVVLSVAALAFSPAVRGDFEGRQLRRAKREREAAAAARRARLGGPSAR